MASGTITLTVNSTGAYSQITGYLSWEETSVNDSQNESTVAVTMTFVRENDSWNQRTGYDQSNLWIKINGEKFEYNGAYTLGRGQTGVVGTSATDGNYGTTGWKPSKTIAHNANGSKSITIEAGGYVGDYAGRVSYIQGCSGSGTAVLTDIPRASTIGTVVGNTMGSTVRVNILRSSGSAFYHKLTWSFASTSGTVSHTPTTMETYINWTPSTSTLAALIPNATSGTCTLTLTTYSNSSLTTQVGDPSSTTITLNVPSSVVPTISSISILETYSTNDTGVFLAYISKPKFTATASGIYGSTISQYSFTFAGQTKSGIANNQTFNPPSESGSVTVYCTVTDSRGRIGTYNQAFTFQPYSAPTITSATVRRKTTDDTKVDVVLIGYAQSIQESNVEKNTMTCYALYTTSSGTYPSQSNTYKITTSGISTSGTSSSDGQKTYTGLSDATSYKFKIIIKDKFRETSQEFRLGTAAVIMDITDQGYIGINKRWERGALDVNGRFYLSNGNIYVGAGKTGLYDGNPGASLGQLTLTLQGSPTLASGGNYPNIRFFGSSGATSETIGFHEYADGFLTIEEKDTVIKHAPARTNGQASAMQFVPLLDPTTISYSGTTGMVDGFLQAWIGHVCNNYAGSGENSLYIGSVLNGSKGIIFWFVYDMGTLTNDLPQYSMGLVIPYSQTASMKRFGTANYAFWSAEVGGGGASYTNADDVLF